MYYLVFIHIIDSIAKKDYRWSSDSFSHFLSNGINEIELLCTYREESVTLVVR